MDELLRTAFEAVIKKNRLKGIVTGKATDVTDTTCTLIREDAPNKNDVRLNAKDDQLDSFATIVPVEGSEILVGVVEGEATECVVLACSEVEKVIWKSGNTTLQFDKNGYKIERDGESLTAILKDLLNAIISSTYTNSAGTTSPVNNLTDFQQILQRIPNLLT